MRTLSGKYQFFAAGANEDTQGVFASAGFAYHKYPMTRRVNPTLDAYSIVALIRLFRRIRPDIVHGFDTKPSVIARLASRISRVPVTVGTVPGLGSLYTGAGVKNHLVKLIYENLQRLSCNQSDLTIFQNASDRQHFINKGITPPQKTSVIRGSGISTMNFDPRRFSRESKHRIRHQFGIDQDSVLVTMISRLIRSKGVLQFVEAASIIRDCDRRIRFLLVGAEDKASRDALKEGDIQKLKEVVTYIGPHHEIASILATTDVFVFPTFYPEGIPRVLLEAASMGLPIITTRAPGCDEVVEHQSNGLLIEKRDVEGLVNAILSLAGNKERRNSFGAESRKRAISLFDLQKIAEQTSVVYQELLKKKMEQLPDQQYRTTNV